MSKNNGRRVMMQRSFYYFTRIYAGLGESAIEELLECDGPILGIEKDTYEDLVFFTLKARGVNNRVPLLASS